MPTSHYVWVVRAHYVSQRDDEIGFVRVFNQFRDEELAWTAVALFWDMMVEEDFLTVEVIRTISFR